MQTSNPDSIDLPEFHHLQEGCCTKELCVDLELGSGRVNDHHVQWQW
jgi:hypothetical protein